MYKINGTANINAIRAASEQGEYQLVLMFCVCVIKIVQNNASKEN